MQIFGVRENFAFEEKPLSPDRAPLEGRIFTKLETSYWTEGSAVVKAPQDLAGEVEIVARLDFDVHEPISVEEALSLPFSYAIGIDFGSGSQGREDGQWWRSKGSRGYAPVGRFISQQTVGDLRQHTVNIASGQILTSLPLQGMENGAAEITSNISKHCQLNRGDLLFLGALCFVRDFSTEKMISVQCEPLANFEMLCSPKAQEKALFTIMGGNHGI